MIQLAQMADRTAVERLAKQVHARHVAWRPDLYDMPQELYDQARFADAVAKRQLYVAKIGTEIIGYALVNIRVAEGTGRIRRKVMLLEELCVDGELRRQGFGTQILTDVKALAKAFGCSGLQLGVFPQNDEAVSFYQKNGFFISSISMQMKL